MDLVTDKNQVDKFAPSEIETAINNLQILIKAVEAAEV